MFAETKNVTLFSLAQYVIRKLMTYFGLTLSTDICRHEKCHAFSLAQYVIRKLMTYFTLHCQSFQTEMRRWKTRIFRSFQTAKIQQKHHLTYSYCIIVDATSTILLYKYLYERGRRRVDLLLDVAFLLTTY